MSVKRYSLNLSANRSVELNESLHGSLVKYHDYAALEARCAALAAESAGLKAAHPQPFGPEMMKALDAYEKHQDETPETGMLDAFFILRDSIRVDTKTTDAFLAEVRASGVEMFAAHKRERQQALRSRSMRMSEEAAGMAADAEDFAAQLRQEAAQ